MESGGEGAGTGPAAAHPAVLVEAQERLRGRDFPALLEAVLARRDEVGDIGRDTDADLRALADRFRRRMGVWDRVGQTFWAALNVLPATAAVTYVLSTGDPVGAAAIKVKLARLFGLKDLYALVAIPVTRGVKQAEREADRGHAGADRARLAARTSSNGSGRFSSRRSPATSCSRPIARPRTPSACWPRSTGCLAAAGEDR